MNPPILATRNLGLDIGGAKIVVDVSLEVAEGELLGIIGPNGAGKTSLFNLLSGIYRPTAGRIELAGRDITQQPTFLRTREGLGRTFQVSSVFPLLTVHENARLAAEDLHVYLGQSHVLQGVSFDVPEGGVTALLGRNGVGKTTTLRAILGLVDRRGSVRLEGTELTGLPTHRIVRRSVGYVPEDRDVFTGLTVAENLRLAERDAETRYDLVYELFPELEQRASQRAGTLSGGQQQMVAIARALLNDNHVL